MAFCLLRVLSSCWWPQHSCNTFIGLLYLLLCEGNRKKLEAGSLRHVNARSTTADSRVSEESLSTCGLSRTTRIVYHAERTPGVGVSHKAMHADTDDGFDQVYIDDRRIIE